MRLFSGDDEVPSRKRKPNRSSFMAPTLEQVVEYCGERENGLDPELFFDYYESQGWHKANGQPVVDWKACVRTWERSEAGRRPWQGRRQPRANQPDATALEAWSVVRKACRVFGDCMMSPATFDEARWQRTADDLEPRVRAAAEAFGWRSIVKAIDAGNEDIIRGQFLRQWGG